MYRPAALLDAAHAAGDATTAEIAARLGVPYQSAYRWTTGRNAPGPGGLAAIERAYGLTPAALFGAAA